MSSNEGTRSAARPQLPKSSGPWLSLASYGTGLDPPPGPRSSPRSMFCWCLAVQIRRLMPSMHWLLGSVSLSLAFLGRNITKEKGPGCPPTAPPGPGASGLTPALDPTDPDPCPPARQVASLGLRSEAAPRPGAAAPPCARRPAHLPHLTLLVLLLGDHGHGHGGRGRGLAAAGQPADLERPEGALECVFGGGRVLLLRVSLPVCGLGCRPVIHLQPHQLGADALAVKDEGGSPLRPQQVISIPEAGTGRRCPPAAADQRREPRPAARRGPHGSPGTARPAHGPGVVMVLGSSRSVRARCPPHCRWRLEGQLNHPLRHGPPPCGRPIWAGSARVRPRVAEGLLATPPTSPEPATRSRVPQTRHVRSTPLTDSGFCPQEGRGRALVTPGTGRSGAPTPQTGHLHLGVPRGLLPDPLLPGSRVPGREGPWPSSASVARGWVP